MMPDVFVPIYDRAIRLTPRQWEVAQLIVWGETNKEIAHQLGIGVGTVDNHVHAIRDRCPMGWTWEGSLWRVLFAVAVREYQLAIAARTT